MGNRTACVRIPGYQRNPKTMRFEFRPPDATMNPYLGYAAMVMAGMDGIKNQIDPGSALDRNLDELSKAELDKIHQLPTSLDRAIKALENDHYYLLEGGVFSEDLIENWVRIRDDDFGNIGRQPTAGEFELYYDC
jgi:glutamine synthetase